MAVTEAIKEIIWPQWFLEELENICWLLFMKKHDKSLV